MGHDKIQLINALIAVVAGALAAWLAVTARVKAAIISESHAKAAAKTANEKLKEVTLEVATLRRQLAKLIEENAALSGKPVSDEEDAAWEASQSFLERAAEVVDAKRPALTIVPKTPPSAPKDSKLVFRRTPMEIDEVLAAQQEESDEVDFVPTSN